MTATTQLVTQSRVRAIGQADVRLVMKEYTRLYLAYITKNKKLINEPGTPFK